MYLRPVHTETDIPTLQCFIKDNPLGIFTTAIASPNYPLLQLTHIPWVYDIGKSDDDLGVIRGHIARNNPHAKAMLEAIQGSSDNRLDSEVMILFNAPHHSYITPHFYTESKPSTGKVVPTWNYAAAQIYGQATILSDDSTWLLKQVDDLTAQEEERFSERKAWKVSDAPTRYIDLLSKAIIGISIKVTRLEGKYKMSQESGKGDVQGVIEGFHAMNTELGVAMADMIQSKSLQF